MKEKKETAGKTAKTIKVNDAVTAFRLINPAKLSKMETEERFAVILATRQLKKVDADFQDLLKDAQEKLEIGKIINKIHANEKLLPAESKAWSEYNDCVNTELKKEVELDFEPLGKEAMERFIESNDFAVSDVMLIMDVLG